MRTDDSLDGQSVLLQIGASLVEVRAGMDVRAIAQLIGHGVGKSGKRPIMKRRKHFPRTAGSTNRQERTFVVKTATLEELVDDFEFLDAWEDRYRYIIELGDELEKIRIP